STSILRARESERWGYTLTAGDSQEVAESPHSCMLDLVDKSSGSEHETIAAPRSHTFRRIRMNNRSSVVFETCEVCGLTVNLRIRPHPCRFARACSCWRDIPC